MTHRWRSNLPQSRPAPSRQACGEWSAFRRWWDDNVNDRRLESGAAEQAALAGAGPSVRDGGEADRPELSSAALMIDAVQA